jgi:hypothetical protein
MTSRFIALSILAVFGARPGLVVAQKCGVVIDVTSPADILTSSDASSQEVQKGSSVVVNSVLSTGDGGMIRVWLDDGSEINLGSKSRVHIVAHDARSQQSHIKLFYGSARFKVVASKRPDSAFEVRSSMALIGLLGGASKMEFVVDADSPVETSVSVMSGIVTIAKMGAESALTVRAGQFSHGDEVKRMTPEWRQQIERRFPKSIKPKGQYDVPKDLWVVGSRSSMTVIVAKSAYNIEGSFLERLARPSTPRPVLALSL